MFYYLNFNGALQYKFIVVLLLYYILLLILFNIRIYIKKNTDIMTMIYKVVLNF